MPSRSDLRAHYGRTYFDGSRDRSQYRTHYDEAELAHKAIALDELSVYVEKVGRIFEAGFGEGFLLAGLLDRGWEIAGVDFSSEGARLHNPAVLDHVKIGDVFDVMDAVMASGERFDVLVCNNLLEHVPEPEALSKTMLDLLVPGGLARFVVPNDDSILQRAAVLRGAAKEGFWVHYPDHLNYFNTTTAPLLLSESGWHIVDVLAEFPIDLFLLNPDSNYERDPALGTHCHQARVAFENEMARSGMDRMLAFRRGCAQAGVGRDVIVYARRPEHEG